MGFHYEDIFLIIGDLGPFQLALVLLVHLPCLSVAINTYAPLFTLFTPNHRCRLPKSVADHDSFANDPGFNRSRVISAWIPRSSDGQFKECCLQNGSDLRPTEHSLCTDFVYDESVLSSSAASEWNFVCESRSLITASQCVMWVGVMTGAVLFGAFSDKFGRAKAVNLAVCANIGSTALLALSPHPGFYFALSFAQGSTLSGLLMSSFVLGVEHVGPSKRHLVSVINHVSMALGCMILALITQWIRNWRTLYLTAAASCIPYLIFFSRTIVPESPRWLFAKHRMEELYSVLERAAHVNKVRGQGIECLAGMEDASISIIQAQPTTGRLRDLFDLKRPNFLGKALIVFLNWFVITLLYYGLTLEAGQISPSIQVNLLTSGAVELVAYVFCALTMMRWGRRQLLVFSHFVSAIALLATLCFPAKQDDGVTLNPIVMALLMVGKFGASISFTVICIYSCEIFPTVVRSLGVGFSSCCGRFGGVMAPLIASLDQRAFGSGDICLDRGYTAEARWSFIITGSLALITGVCTLMLPETLNEPLPETCEDAEENGLLPCFRGFGSRQREAMVSPSSDSHTVVNNSQKGFLGSGGTDERQSLLKKQPSRQKMDDGGKYGMAGHSAKGPTISTNNHAVTRTSGPATRHVSAAIAISPHSPFQGPTHLVKNHYVRLVHPRNSIVSDSSSDLEIPRGCHPELA